MLRSMLAEIDLTLALSGVSGVDELDVGLLRRA
jgi:hypothetical protein